jgi:hypothetical protein
MRSRPTTAQPRGRRLRREDRRPVSGHIQPEAGLVEREQRGSLTYYRVVPGSLDTLRELFG